MQTVTRLYDTYGEAQQVVSDLQDFGVPANDISLVANGIEGTDTPASQNGAGAAMGAGLGVVVGGGAGLLAGIGALAIPGVGPVVAAGWLVSALAGAGVAGVAGGLVGALVGSGIHEDEAHVYCEGVRRGGAVVAARVPEAQAPRVEAIMVERAVDWKNRSAAYHAGGWNRFDEHAPPYADTTQRADVPGSR